MIPSDSGSYRLSNGTLSYRSEVYGSWDLPIAEITLIGEYTNEDGPFADDFFLVFLTANDGGWHEASFYGEGRDEILRELSALKGSEIVCGLCLSMSFASQVIWPVEKRGEEIFDFQPAGWLKNRQVIRKEIGDI